MASEMVKQHDYLFKLLMVGDQCVGKTCLLLTFANNYEFKADIAGLGLLSTIGTDFTIQNIEVDGKKIKLQLWDTPGAERFTAITRTYFKSIDAVIIIYDVTNEESFSSAKNKWLKDVEENSADDVCTFLVGNKSDLIDKRTVGFTTAKEFADQHQISFLEISTKNAASVKLAFMTIAAEIKRKRDKKEEQKLIKMRKMIQANISDQGEMYLRNVKGILVGPPGAGKTITLDRLTGKMKNISTHGKKASTGIEKPQTFHLYRNIEKKSIVIDKEWSPQSLDQQMGTVLHSTMMLRTSTDQPRTTQHIHTTHQPSSTASTTNAAAQPRNTNTPKIQALVNSVVSSVSGAFKINSQDSSLPGLVEELIKDSKWEEVQKILQNVKHITLFHVIDTGGQPEFYDILPLLLNGPCFALIFINLIHPLNQPVHVTYRHTPDAHSLIQYESIYNQLQLIHMTLATCHSLNSQKDTNNKSVAFILATHLDKAEEINIEEVMKEIEESMKDASYYKKDVLLKYLLPGGKIHQFLYALNNYSGDEEEISILRNMLTHLIENTFEPERLPTSWGVFHLILRHKYEEQGLCTLQQSIQLGKICGLKKEREVKEVLGYFHTRFGTILYYAAIKSLQSVVICDPNLVFRPITKLVSESFRANPVNIETAKVIRTTGEIDIDFLEEIYAKADTSQRIKTSAIVDLLKYHNIITELVTKDGVRKLFMSCLLKPCPPEEVPKTYFGATVEPLLFTFQPDGYQPVSLFHVLASKLSKKFILDVPRYKDKLTFVYGSAMVEIFSNVYHLDIRINSSNPQRCILLRNTLQGILDSIVAEVPHMAGTSVQCAFYCPNSTAEFPHSALLHMNEERLAGEPFAVLICEKCKNMRNTPTCIPLKKSHVIWFEAINSAAKLPPTLSDEKGPEIPSSTPAGEGQLYQHSPIDSVDSDDISPIAVFNRHISELLSMIFDVDKFVTDLTSAGVISEDDILSCCSPGDEVSLQGVKVVLDTLHSCLVKSSDPEDILVKFSTVLSNQNSEGLKRISTNIKGELVQSHTPDPDDMFEVLRSRASEWDDIGRELKVLFGFRQSLQKEGVMSSDTNKLERVLRQWVESKCSEVTWRQAIRVFGILQFNDVIESTQQFLRREHILNKYFKP